MDAGINPEDISQGMMHQYESIFDSTITTYSLELQFVRTLTHCNHSVGKIWMKEKAYKGEIRERNKKQRKLEVSSKGLSMETGEYDGSDTI